MAKEDSIENILDESLIALKAAASKKSGKDSISLSGFYDASDLAEADSTMELELNSFLLQYILGSKDLKTGTILEIIGPEQVGKTTFLLSIVGDFLAANPNIPFLDIITEGKNKMPSIKRISSCLSEDKVKAEKILKQIVFYNGHALKDTLETMHMWLKITRDNMDAAGISKDTPILIGIDTISKLMPKTEAAALGYGDATKPKTLLDDVTNMDFPKMIQRWTRAIVDILESYKAMLIIVSHQNEKVDMNSFASRFASAESSASDNKTKIGGRGLNQSSTNQLTLVRVGGKTNTTTKEYLSHIIKVKCVKNSRNADRRDGRYELRVEKLKDTDTKYERAINFDYGLADLFAEKRILNTKALTKETFRCDALGEKEILDRYEFAKRFNENPALKNKIGYELGIRGYTKPEDIIENNVIPTSDFTPEEESSDADVLEDLNDTIKNTSIELKPKRGRPKKDTSSVDEKYGDI